MGVAYKFPRGTRANLDAKALAGTIEPGQAYLITDESRIAVGLTVSTFEVYAKASDAAFTSAAALAAFDAA